MADVRKMKETMIIIGSGAAGLSVALEFAKNGTRSILISDMPSERSQSVMAEGGINAAMDTQRDCPEFHAEETMKAGRYIADSKAVHQMTEEAPKIIKDLFESGMAFTLNENKKPDVRAFGGQSVKRTFFAASNTGKQLMYVLIDQVRRYEAEGLIERLTGWEFLKLLCDEKQAYGCILTHKVTQQEKILYGKVVIASGGLNGMFGNATGSVRNTGAVTANLFTSGVRFSNGEFIQYHPTTVKLHAKNMLITEAVRGEGGRLYVLENGKPFYFMEEKYPELGNLMPRDVISKEEWLLMQQGKQIYLDMRHLDQTTTNVKLKGVIEDCQNFLGLDPRKEPIPVMPGIHYFMGGIWVDTNHRTSMRNLYAAGECACQYHGANRLGGNSLLGALYGGKIAARSAMEDTEIIETPEFISTENHAEERVEGGYTENLQKLQDILRNGLEIIRSEERLNDAQKKLDTLLKKIENTYDITATKSENQSLRECGILGKAMILCAKARKESRGAHQRSDYPSEREEYKKQTIAQLVNGVIEIHFEKVGE